MAKKGDDVAVDGDDVVRTSVTQTRVTATLCTREYFSGLSIHTVALSTYQTGKNVMGGDE
jgi:hypothetical protein